jgi:hypothetical protein
MAYVDPQSIHNPTTGQVAPASWGDAVRDGLQYLASTRPHCRVYNSASLTISNNTRTAVTFNSERVDVGGMHSTSSNTSRITITDAGFYLISGSVEWAANATGHRNCEIRLNGTTLIAISADSVVGATTHQQSVSTLYQLAAADYIEMTVFQLSGGNLNLSVAANYSPELSAIWMSV